MDNKNCFKRSNVVFWTALKKILGNLMLPFFVLLDQFQIVSCDRNKSNAIFSLFINGNLNIHNYSAFLNLNLCSKNNYWILKRWVDLERSRLAHWYKHMIIVRENSDVAIHRWSHLCIVWNFCFKWNKSRIRMNTF